MKFRRSLIVAGLLLMAAVTLACAAPPVWWSGESTKILDESVNDGNNHAPANLGQLKHVATQAKEHLDANLAGGSGPAVAAMVAGLVPPHTRREAAANYAVANLGQLKAVAKPFYDRLIAAGYATKANLIARGYPAEWPYDYPWNPATPVEANYAPANIGQLKMVFSFDLGVDGDTDGLPDIWELGYFGNLRAGGRGDADGDGRTNAEEYTDRSDPANYYSQKEGMLAPVLHVVEGDFQSGSEGAYLQKALSVRVLSGTTPLRNAPVIFTVVSGSGGLSSGFERDSTCETLTVRSGADGIARAWYKQGGALKVTSTITARAGGGPSVVFHSLTVMGVLAWFFLGGLAVLVAAIIFWGLRLERGSEVSVGSVREGKLWLLVCLLAALAGMAAYTRIVVVQTLDQPSVETVLALSRGMDLNEGQAALVDLVLEKNVSAGDFLAAYSSVVLFCSVLAFLWAAAILRQRLAGK